MPRVRNIENANIFCTKQTRGVFSLLTVNRPLSIKSYDSLKCLEALIDLYIFSWGLLQKHRLSASLQRFRYQLSCPWSILICSKKV